MWLFVLSRCPFDISFGIMASVIGLSQLSSYFLFIKGLSQIFPFFLRYAIFRSHPGDLNLYLPFITSTSLAIFASC